MKSAVLLKLANTTMPFGKYQGKLLMDLPAPYLIWFSKNGFPAGELGNLMQLMLEIDNNGDRALLFSLKNGYSST